MLLNTNQRIPSSYELWDTQSSLWKLFPQIVTAILPSHVGKYDRADDRPKLSMLAIDIRPMIDRGFDDNCGPILACYIGPKIAPDDRPKITARVKPMIFKIHYDINNDNKI